MNKIKTLPTGTRLRFDGRNIQVVDYNPAAQRYRFSNVIALGKPTERVSKKVYGAPRRAVESSQRVTA